MNSPIHDIERSDPLKLLKVDLNRFGGRPLLRELSAYAVVVYRLGQWSDQRRGVTGVLARKAYWLLHRFVISLTGIEIPKGARIGPGLRIHHAGVIVVHPDVKIGQNFTLRHGVTIGERSHSKGTPVIGDDVEVGAYAQILGPVNIGSGSRIGAMALVLQDVPPGGVATAPAAQIRGPR